MGPINYMNNPRSLMGMTNGIIDLEIHTSLIKEVNNLAAASILMEIELISNWC